MYNEFSLFVIVGIGVTPMASVLKFIRYKVESDPENCPVKRVHFYWMNRDTSSFEWFLDLLASMCFSHTQSTITHPLLFIVTYSWIAFHSFGKTLSLFRNQSFLHWSTYWSWGNTKHYLWWKWRIRCNHRTFLENQLRSTKHGQNFYRIGSKISRASNWLFLLWTSSFVQHSLRQMCQIYWSKH